MLVTATYLHARSARTWLRIAAASNGITAAALRTPGFAGGRARIDRHGGFWTVTGWESRAALLAFKEATAHGAAMPRLDDLADRATFRTWEDTAVPSFEAAAEVLGVAPARGVTRALRPARRTPPTAPSAGGRRTAGSAEE